jgi:hypothetical protein
MADNRNSSAWQNLGDLLGPLAERIAAIHIDSPGGSEQAIIRFHNEYGVCVLPSGPSPGNNVYQMLVVRFHGLGANDYELAQYAPVPEVNWCSSLENILSVCNRVSLLQNKVPTSNSPAVSLSDH